MDQHSYYQPFNHLQYPQYPPSPAPAPGSPSDFIYNSANSTSIFQSSRPSRPSCSLVTNESTSTSPSPSNYPPVPMGYGPSRPVEQSFPTYLPSLPEPSPSLPEPTPGLAEHRRQRQREPKMNMGPGPSKMVPPALSLGGNRGGDRGSDSGESIVVIKQEEVSSSPVLVSVPMVKKWEPRMPRMPTEGMGNEMGSGSGSGTWENRGEGVMERVIPPVVPSMGIDTGMEIQMEMGMGMEPTIMPKMGLFKPIRWDGPSSSSSASRSSRARARRAHAWEVETVEEGGNDVPLQRTYARQNRNENRNRNRNRNRSRNKNDETEEEQPSNAPISSFSSHSRSPKRLKTSPSGFAFRSNSGSAETEKAVAVKIKQEPGLSPSPSAIFAQIPMYNNGTIDNTAAGYEDSGHDNPPSSRSISPLTRVPIPRRLLFPTPNRTSTGTNSQLSLRGVSKQLKKERNRQMAVDREESREESREQSRERRGERSRERSWERRGEGFWSLAGGSKAESSAVAQQEQHQHRGSSEERENGWTTISGSSEEGEVSSHYENSYSCGQERGNSLGVGEISQSHHFQSSSPPAHASSSSSRYGPGSVPSLSASQLREEQYRQAIQMVQDTCLEASKRYIRAHCVNRGARGGDSPDTSTLSHETVETRFARKARRKRKLKSRHASPSSSTSSPSPPPSRRRRRNRKRTTTTPPSSPNSPHFHLQPHSEIHCTSSLLPNISQICTLLWSRSQSLRLHEIDSIELHTARNMYWLLSWAETVAFAVPPPTPLSATNGTSNTSASSSSFLGVPGVPSSLEDLGGARGRWCRERDPPEHAPTPGDDVLNGAGGYMWRRRDSEEEEEEEEEGLMGGIEEVLESKNGAAVWCQQWDSGMWRVFEEGGMLCEFLGYGEGVERIARVREFYGF